MNVILVYNKSLISWRKLFYHYLDNYRITIILHKRFYFHKPAAEGHKNVEFDFEWRI